MGNVNYRTFLKSEFWKTISLACKERDGFRCVRCKSGEWLQAHHKEYPTDWSDTTLGMLETLCRKCHRLEHGLGPTDFEVQLRKIKRHINLFLTKPPPSDWIELKKLMDRDDYLWDFGELMFMYVAHSWSHVQEGGKSDWWMDKSKNEFWMNRAYRIRESIWGRAFVEHGTTMHEHTT